MNDSARFFAALHIRYIKCIYDIMQPRLPPRFDLLIIRSDALLFYNANTFAVIRANAPHLRQPRTRYTHIHALRPCLDSRIRSQQKARTARPADYSSAAVARRAPTNAAVPFSNSYSRSMSCLRVWYKYLQSAISRLY